MSRVSPQSQDGFVAIDVETANSDVASICQIGLVEFRDGLIHSQWETLVDPEDEFDWVNISIHGIDREKVAGSPRFPDLSDELSRRLSNRIVVSHMPFDRVAMTQAAEKHDLSPIACTWLDSARIARRAWKQFARRGYGLANVAAWCGIDFCHHDAAEDARAAGQILVRAIADTGLSLQDWIVRSRQPITPPKKRGVKSLH
jgi:DNA polymerase-3 subunit epsilon